MVEHNLRSVSTLVSGLNPLAIIKSKNTGDAKNAGKSVSKHFEGNIPISNLICCYAMVSLAGRNFIPTNGLHNGAVGVVLDIVFRDGDNPNDGDLPLYILVNFPQYNGEPWDKDNPTVSVRNPTNI